MSISCDWLVCINSNYRLFITIHCYIVPTIQQPLLRDICMMIQYTAVPLFFCFTGYGGVGLSYVDGY